MRKRVFLLCMAALALAIASAPAHAQSRNASFVNPNTISQKSADGKNASTANTVVADPASIDAGETLVNVARRITVFFFNGFRNPVQINELTLNADGNVRSKVITDDCKGLKTLPVQDKCSVALEITPSSPGPWSVELLLNHSGTGRIARAEVNGTTLGKADEKSEGLAISKKIAAPLDFGTVIVNEEKAARTMLIENDSTVPLLISSIDLIAAEDEGLTVRKMGCKEGDELKPSESCPITVMWEPTFRGNVATDLIVRHSGNLGFVVVPIRGAGSDSRTGKEDDVADIKSSPEKSKRSSSSSLLMPGGPGKQLQLHSSQPSLDALPLPKSTLKMDGSDEGVTPLKSSAILPRKPPSVEDMTQAEPAPAVSAPEIVLIGTVGGRAILGDSQDQPYMVGLGEKVSIGGTDVELLQLDPTRAVIMAAGKRMNLTLRNKQTIQPKSAEKSDDEKDSSDSEKPKRKRSSFDSGDSKPEKRAADNPAAIPATPLPFGGSGLNSMGSIGSTSSNSPAWDGSGSRQLNNAMTAQDVLNMIKP